MWGTPPGYLLFTCRRRAPPRLPSPRQEAPKKRDSARSLQGTSEHNMIKELATAWIAALRKRLACNPSDLISNCQLITQSALAAARKPKPVPQCCGRQSHLFCFQPSLRSACGTQQVLDTFGTAYIAASYERKPPQLVMGGWFYG
jgi:hypothetical protein